MSNYDQHENMTALMRCINMFLDNKFGNKNTGFKNNYKHYILGFVESVRNVYPAVVDNPEQIFRNFQFDEIERSIEDYILKKNEKAKHSNHKIEKMSIIMKYTYVVTEFFMYLSYIGWLNANLIARLYLDDEDNKSRQNMFERIAKKYNLSNDINSLEAISEDDAEHLLSNCERKIFRAINKLKTIFYEYNYNVFLRNIVLELMLLFGIKCSKIINIKYSDYDKTTSKIMLGNQKIKLPPQFKSTFYGL